MYNPQIETFVKVADAGSFKKAAEEMYITPAAVIKQINSLEKHLNVQLFYRTNRGLMLTAGGQSLYHDCVSVIDFSKKAVLRARNAMEKDNVVRVGTSTTVSADFLREYWQKIRQVCPSLYYEIVPLQQGPDIGRATIMNLGKDVDIISGFVDEAFQESHHCRGIMLYNEEVGLLAPVNNPLSGRKKLKISDLKGQHVALPSTTGSHIFLKMKEDLQRIEGIFTEEIESVNIYSMNECARNNWLIPAIPEWSQAHPMLKYLSVDWDYAGMYGLLYSNEPSVSVKMLIDAIHVITR